MVPIQIPLSLTLTMWQEKLRAMLGLSEAARMWVPIVLSLFISAFIVRVIILLLFVQTDPGFIIDNDSVGYLSLAENLETGNGFSWNTGMPFTPDSFRTPAYPFFLYLHHFLFGSYISALVTQIFLSLVIGLITLQIAVRYFSTKTGIVAVAVFLFMPFSLLVTERYLTQICYTATIMGAVWFWLTYLSREKKKDLFIAATLVPVSALIRPISIFFTAPFVASLAIGWWWKKVPLKRAVVASGVMVACFLIVIAPWIYRNYTVFGVPYLSSITAVQLYFYDAPAIYANAQNIDYEEARTALNKHIEEVTGYSVADNPIVYTELSELTPILKREGARLALADPWAFVETRAVQFFKFFTRDGIRYWIEHYGVDTYHGWALVPIIFERILLLGFTVGFFWYALMAFLKKNLAVTTLVVVVMYFAVLSGVMSSAGLRFPAEPLFLLIGTAGIFELVTLLRKK